MTKRMMNSPVAKELAKAFRGSSSPVSLGSFSGSMEECLEMHFDLLVDIWKVDKYAAEVEIRQAVKLAKGCDMAVCMGIGKSIKSLLTSIHYKRRRLTSGERSPKVLLRFLNAVEEPALPILQSQMSKPMLAKAMPMEVVAKSSSSSSAEIAALYGLAAKPEDKLSQVTVSDDMGECCGQPEIVLDSQEGPPPMEEPAKGYGYYFDNDQGCIIRFHKVSDGQLIHEPSNMQPGKAGFAEAIFPDGSIHVSEIANMELFPETSFKKPAACLKKPAKAEAENGCSPDNVDAEMSEESEAEMPIEKETPGEPAKAEIPKYYCTESFQMSNGVVLKFGPFTGQSYITYKEPGKAKFTLLSCCSDKKAARNGKCHKQIVKALFEHLKTLQSMPSKEACGAFVLSLLAK
jgi:hypothetical protein